MVERDQQFVCTVDESVFAVPAFVSWVVVFFVLLTLGLLVFVDEGRLELGRNSCHRPSRFLSDVSTLTWSPSNVSSTALTPAFPSESIASSFFHIVQSECGQRGDDIVHVKLGLNFVSLRHVGDLKIKGIG